MADTKRAGRGGRRVGAGRPRKAPDAAAADYGTTDALEYLTRVLADPGASAARKDMAARTLLPYQHKKLIDIEGFGNPDDRLKW
jgi:hypothetical protein